MLLARGFARQCSSKTLATQSCRQWHPRVAASSNRQRKFVVSNSRDLCLPVLRRSCVTQPRVARAASYPGFGIPTADVPRRGSVNGLSRMTQPFQGRPSPFSSPQGSPRSRATLGYGTQSLRDKGRGTPRQTWNDRTSKRCRAGTHDDDPLGGWEAPCPPSDTPLESRAF